MLLVAISLVVLMVTFVNFATCGVSVCIGLPSFPFLRAKSCALRICSQWLRFNYFGTLRVTSSVFKFSVAIRRKLRMAK